jgi:toxin YhaV
LFLDEIETLIECVEKLRAKDPVGYVRKNASKRLAAIAKLAFDVIPADPTLSDYRQGSTLGNEYRHWFRAKFFQQYRLFFRFDSDSKVIVHCWANDEKNKRAYGRKSDAYRVFVKMLNSGHPPDSWAQLLKEAERDLGRLHDLSKRLID